MIPNKDVFCSSPWLHVRIGHSGKFYVCRWADRAQPNFDSQHAELSIQHMSLFDYLNSAPMVELRSQLLAGVKPTACSQCYYQDSFQKLSGRKKQLYRSKLDDLATFDTRFDQSPHYEMFKYSQDNSGRTDVQPIDLQIDLDNVCNVSCIMCTPSLSTRLTSDYIKLNQIDPAVFAAPPKIQCWASDPALVEKFIDEVKKIPNIDYIHFLGGETLYVESFYIICEALIDAGLAKSIIVGTTTNGTVYSDRLEKLIPQFRGFHLGLSIESVAPLNDYIRFGSEINEVLRKFDCFIKLREVHPRLHLELRITPNVFSIYYIDELIQYMADNTITAESCFILNRPSCLRIELLPAHLKEVALQKLIAVAEKNVMVRSEQNPDTRNPELFREVLSNVTYSYIDFLTNMNTPDNVEEERGNLVKFLKGFELLRGNSILTYAPEFKTFLTEYGY
jgi:hypothetical protein